MYKNAASKEVVELEKQFPGDFSKIAHLMKGELYRQSFHETGDTDVCVYHVIRVVYCSDRGWLVIVGSLERGVISSFAG